MRAIQILMDEPLIDAVDREAKRSHLDRSKLIRAALAQFLASKRREARERADRRGYERRPQTGAEIAAWEKVAEWPED